MWSKIVASFRCLKFTEQEINAIYSLIAALFHLATAGATKGSINIFTQLYSLYLPPSLDSFF